MSKLNVVNVVTRKFGKTGLKMKKYSPEVLIGAGIVGVITSTVMACRATTKINDILDETEKQIEKTHIGLEHPEKLKDGATYTVDDQRKDLITIYTKTGIQLAKLYGPSIILGAVSIGAILSGHNILRRRNVALAAAYATIDKGFKEYRGRVVERFGEEMDRELRYNIKAKEVEETVTDDKGKEKTVKKTVNTAEIHEYSQYARFFDESCAGWTKDPEYNHKMLNMQQRFANDKLKADGYLFLNDVYEMLGMQKSKAGQIVGWVYDENNPNVDNYVDFGIYDDIHNEAKRNFVNGFERSILLDFNVDGNILDLI